jgi:urea transporter
MAAPPTPATRLVAHGLVGVGVAIVVAKLASTSRAVKAIIGAVLGIIAHAMLDAPVASLLAGLGFQF